MAQYYAQEKLDCASFPALFYSFPCAKDPYVDLWLPPSPLFP